MPAFQAATRRSPTATLLLVSLGVFFTALDQTVVVTVLPPIMTDLKVGIADLDRASWIITGYLLGYTVAIPLIARLADVYGYARLFMVALALFAIGSALVAAASSLPWLVGARIVQALGGGATIPIGMAIATRAVRPSQRAMAIGIVGAAAEAGVVLGPLYGGAIEAALGWRWLFWLNLPQVLIILPTVLLIPRRPPQPGRIDYLGGALLVAGLSFILVALSRSDVFEGSSPTPYLLACVGLLLLAAMAWVERRTVQPLLPGIFFRSRAALSALGTKLLVGGGLIVAMVTVPLMTNTVLGEEPLAGGLRLMRLTGALPFGAIIGGMLAHRLGSRKVTVPGLALAALGLYFMGQWDLDIGDPSMSLHLALTGFGFGLVIAPLFLSAMEEGGDEYHATSASLVVVARMLGMAVGVACLSSWGVGHFQGLTEGVLLPLQAAGESTAAYQERVAEYRDHISMAGLDVFQNFFRGAAVLLLVAIIPALGLKRRKSAPPTAG